MLVWLPVSLLIFAALGILILQRAKPGFGVSWLVSVSVSFLVWCITLAFGWVELEAFTINNWAPIRGAGAALVFQIGSISWPYAFSMATLLLAVILTVPARLRFQSVPTVWAGSMVITGSAMLAILADNPLALLLAWSAIDLIEIVLILSGVIEHGSKGRAVVTYGARVAGTMVVVWTMAFSRAQGQVLGYDTVSAQAGLYLLVAAGLRLGVVPLYVPYVKEYPMRRGFGTIVRLASPASSLVVLGHLPDLVIPFGWAVTLSALTAVATLYGAVMWLTSEEELSGRPYWIIALAGMAVACVVRGRSSASIVWGITMLLSGSQLFLFSARQRRITFVPLLGLLGLIGLPFTPAVWGWRGLIVYPFNLLDIVFMITHALLVLGYLRHALRKGEGYAEADRWIQIVYPLGLILLAVAHWIISIRVWTLGVPSDYWWAGIVSLVSCGIAWGVWYLFLRQTKQDGERAGWLMAAGRSIAGRSVGSFFRLGWLYDFLWLVFQGVQRVFQALMFIMEGDGGVLWSLLLLVLLISLIRVGGGI